MSAIGPAIPPHLLKRPSDANGDEDTKEVGPQLPPHAPPADDEDEEDDYAPALPPDMIASSSKTSVKGPTVPHPQRAAQPSYPHDGDDDSDDDVGPRPLPAGARAAEPDAVAEFIAKEEKRRREVAEAAKPKAPKRDEWMLVPPTPGTVLGSLDPAKLSKPRQFARTAAPTRGADNSLWTETPAERQQRLADEVSGKKRPAANADTAASAAEGLEVRKRARIDAELRASVEEHTRRTRGAALVDMHSAAGKGEEKDESRAIWDRDRDMGVGGRLMDAEKRNKMIQESKGLGDRFSRGKTGGFY
ncbi:hypothetical protein GGX14DRAFT_658361 [Mycena pura]|uniref:DUF3752 domain-containing protein n=1 Tax=Mycena pura TaxID=153505 RepID=A0AAD7E2G2_9AGAR|nr:hypothetical protein GGX14DRAFT_658361 [Mycena pura]